MEGREVKDRLYEHFAQVAKATASPARIELLELVAQAERSVDALAGATGMGVTNTSAHLQVLRRAGLVETRKDGTKVFYRIAGDDVGALLVALRSVARARLAEVDRLMRDYFESRDEFEPLSAAELVERASRGEIVIFDVQPPRSSQPATSLAHVRFPSTSSTRSSVGSQRGPRSSPTAAVRTAYSPHRPSSVF